MMRKLLVGVLFLAFLLPLQVNAQSRLSEEDIVLLDRALTAMAGVREYESFNRNDSVREYIFSTVTTGDVVDESREDRVLERSSIYSGDAVQTVFSGSYASHDNGLSFAYTMNGEVRYVDNTLYVRGEYEKTNGIAPSLPEGWQTDQVALNTQPFDDLLELTDFYDQMQGDTFSTFIDAAVVVRTVVDQVSSTMVTLPNQQSAEEISFHVPAGGLYALISQNPDFNPLDPTLEIYQQANEDSHVTVRVVVDSAGMMIKVSYLYQLAMLDVDLFALNSNTFPEGSIGSFVLDYSDTRYYSNINQVAEVPVAPAN